jgi:hypothetical protein
LILLLILSATLIGAAIYFVMQFLAHRGTDSEFIFRRLEEPFNLFGRDLNPYWRLAFLIPLLVVAFVYAGWMYFRDGRSVGWAWATFLAMLRCSVYIILALAFLLPAVQSWSETKQQSRVLVLWDVSGSVVHLRDDPPTADVPFDKMPTRQDKVIAFLTNSKIDFMSRLQKNNEVAGYRFGRLLDENYEIFDRAEATNKHWTAKEWEDLKRDTDQSYAHEPKTPEWSREEWQDWLKPVLEAAIPVDTPKEERLRMLALLDKNKELFSATNLGDPLLNLLNREEKNLLQGVIIFTDGRSTEGGPAALKEVSERCRKAKIPIFVVALGEDRPKVRLDISDLRLPKQARPEDEFRAEVIVTGEGMAGETVDVFLEVYRPSNPKEKFELPPEKVTFGPGQPPHGQAVFKINPGLFPRVAAEKPGEGNKPEYEVGEWKFVAKVMKDKREVFDKKEHRSDPASLHVVKRPLRVLLFASAPTREYHFVRTFFVRETQKKRADVSVYLQPAPGRNDVRDGVVQDVPKEQVLKVFPTTFTDEGDTAEGNKFLNLGMYDLIVAFDPDWTRLTMDQLNMLKKWVDLGRGLIVVGGPINTLQLAPLGSAEDKPRNEQLKAIFEILPVVVEDSRVQDVDRATDDPWRLNFAPVAADMEFMRLEEGETKEEGKAGLNPLKPWEDFFFGKEGNAGGKDTPPVRGMYNFYPVKRAKDSAQVLATFSDPRAKLADGKEMPYLVLMPYGAGKVFWIGSGEVWRLRQYKEAYHERFWAKLGRFVGSGSLTQLNRRINTIHGRTFQSNTFVPIDAQILGKEMKPLNEKAKVELTLSLPRATLEKDQVYLMTKKLSTAETEWNGTFTSRFLVKAPGEYNYTIKVEETGDTDTGKFIVKESNPELDNTRPDFETMYELASEADDYLPRVKNEQDRKEIKARLQRPRLAVAEKSDKKEAEAVPEDKPRYYFDLANADLIPKCISSDYRETKSRGRAEDLWDGGYPADPKERWFSWTLAVIVGLLSIEWLSRKLLRLA